MRPDLLKLQLMQQMLNQQQANPQPVGGMPEESQMQPMISDSPRNPIGEGSMAAMEAAKRSLQMNENENKRALGRAMMHFFSGKNLPEPGAGLAGNLGAINASFLPAMETYDAERSRIEQQNYALMQQEEEQRRHAAREQEELRRHQAAEEQRMIEHEEMKRVHDAQIEHHHATIRHLAEKDQLENRWKEVEKDLEPGVEPIAKYEDHPSMWNFINKDIESTVEQGNYARDGMSIISRLKQVMKESPHIYNKMDYILLNKYNQDPGFWTQQAINLKVPKKDMANFQEAAKLTADLFALEAKSVPARGINMFMEKQLRQKVPDIKMAPGAFNKVADRAYKKFESTYKNAAKKSDHAERGLWYRNKIKPMEEEEQQVIYDTQTKPAMEMSVEELAAAIANRRKEIGIE